MHRLVSLTAPVSPDDLAALVRLLAACVEGGASIGFMAPLAPPEAEAYWRKVIADLPAGIRRILVARDNATGEIIGSAQLAFETRANGRHRAEVQKVMVLPSRRRQGIAAGLMAGLEHAARERNVTLLFLDTSEGRGGARAFYETLGYRYAGGIPGYALDPDGAPAANAIFYRTLGPA
ncbi:GNAT family N-acetyltransferase [Opitutaceae bacterium EW11]|nr:GNAT family N-acetyltransferase [Opitutaceae bacterium EW11]